MKLFLVAGLFAISALASAQTCKVEMYGPQGEFITSIRTNNDPSCVKAGRACMNWRAWYYAPRESTCYMVEDDGRAIIDYIRFPDYDVYYGYPGSPYTRIPRTPPTTTTTETTTCRYDGYGREYCTTTVNPNPRPNPRPNPETRPTPTPRPNPRPNPETRPTPSPRPNTETRPTPTQPTTPTPIPPTPSPESDAIRAIEAGETVIFNSAPYLVVSVENTNFYNLKPLNGRDRERDIVKDVARQYVAITRGCHAGFCGNESVIVIASASYAAVAGIEYDGQLVTKTITRPEVLSFDVNPNTLAWTKGCSPEGNGKVCVGNTVIRGRGLYYTVAGIQLDGKVVIENKDGDKKLTVNVDPVSLLIVR